jgi:hypothetical protein
MKAFSLKHKFSKSSSPKLPSLFGEGLGMGLYSFIIFINTSSMVGGISKTSNSA